MTSKQKTKQQKAKMRRNDAAARRNKSFFHEARSNQLVLHIVSFIFEFVVALGATCSMIWFIRQADRGLIVPKTGTNGKDYNVYTMAAFFAVACALTWLCTLMTAASFYKSYFLLKANYLPTVKRNSIDLLIVFIFYILIIILTFAFFDLAKYRINYDETKANIANTGKMFRVFTATPILQTVNFAIVIANTIILGKTLYNVQQKRGTSEEIKTSANAQ